MDRRRRAMAMRLGLGCAVVCALGLGSALAQDAAVKVKKAGGVYVLQNAYVTAEVDRTTGDLKSLKYQGQEFMGYGSGHHAGYWEQNPSGAAEETDGISIDPATNGGERAEVFVKGRADGKPISHSNGNGMICDLEIRYSLGKEDHGIYTYAVFSHPASYPASGIGESRYGAKLNGALFDWISIDPRHNQAMPSGYDWDHGVPMNMKEARRLTTGPFAGRVEHKYDYSADLFDAPAFGWQSTKKHVGIFFVNTSQEFMSGGPTKVELTGHIDDDQGGDPTLLDYWRSSHYGGSTLDLPAGEDWTKVVGPILVYVNDGPTPAAIYADAMRQAHAEEKKWPFEWVKGVDYPHAAERAHVAGKLAIEDVKPVAPGRMWVGLVPVDDAGGGWQHDAKHYQFWVNATADGGFQIPEVRAGKYVLAAIRDGVFGEFDGPVVTLAAGQALDLGTLKWVPARYGKQLWEIGIPNRSGIEFLGGDQYNRWGNYLIYAKLFPNDVQYTVGKSDFRKDWFYEEVPNSAHGSPPGAFDGGETVWTIRFDAAGPEKGVAVLRTGICGAAARHVFITLNGKQVGDLGPLTYNATINRDGVQGSWSEHDVSFPASLLKSGANTMELRVPKGSVMSGVIYDYLRLELDETGKGVPVPHPDGAKDAATDGL